MQTVAPRTNNLFARLPTTTDLSVVVTHQPANGRGTLTRTTFPEAWNMVDQSAAGPSALMNTPSWTAAPSYTEHTSRAQAALREYIADEPGSYIPSQQNLMNQKSIIMCQISSEVGKLLDLTNPALASQTRMDMSYERLGGETLPRFYEALSDEDFCNLCLRIYGVGTKTELRAKVASTPICMNKFMRGFVAAAVTDWVFDERHVSVPQMLSSDKIGVSRVYEEEVRGSMLQASSLLQPVC